LERAATTLLDILTLSERAATTLLGYPLPLEPFWIGRIVERKRRESCSYDLKLGLTQLALSTPESMRPSCDDTVIE